MADAESEPKEAREDSVNSSNPEQAGPSTSQTSSSLPGPSLPSPGIDAATTSSNAEGRNSNYFTAMDANLAQLQSRAQRLIDRINEGRKRDQTMMTNFNTNLNIKVAELTKRLEDRIFQIYEQNNMQLQARFQEFTKVIERIEQLQEELKQVCQTLVTVYKDLCLPPQQLKAPTAGSPHANG